MRSISMLFVVTLGLFAGSVVVWKNVIGAEVGDCLGATTKTKKLCDDLDDPTPCTDIDSCTQDSAPGDCFANGDGRGHYRDTPIANRNYGECEDTPGLYKWSQVTCTECSSYYCALVPYFEVKLPDGRCGYPCNWNYFYYRQDVCPLP